VARDCVQLASFDITHDYTVNTLGKDRSQVGTATSMLKWKGLIRHQRGRMTILDRQQMEASACECYRSVKTSFAAMRL